MVPEFAKSFTYQVNWRSRSYHAGYHRGAQGGLGVEFRGNVPLVDYPDARRIDINQTIRDPNEQVHVRIFKQKNATPIYAICDLSASMQFKGQFNKMALMAEIAASVAYSAQQAGDTFSFIGFDKVVREDWLTKSSYRMQDAYELAQQLINYAPAAAGSDGLLDVNEFIGQARSLVFLVSDFHMPLATIEAGLNTLSTHHIVPIVLWDAEEYKVLPNFGFSTIIDPETGEQRTLFFRKELKKRFAEMFAQRKAELEDLFMRYDSPPYFAGEGFDADAITEYFYQFSAL
ncbi:MAG TPA: DUF58 domain-containing protein [Methylotenera sp.]|nr:DUF58 domain-containing protein [Methylotenera sp.]